MKLMIKLFITALSAFFLGQLLVGVHFDNFVSSLIFAVILGIMNLFVRPILALLSLPITILTLGLFSLVINAVIILLSANLMSSMMVDGFWWAFLFSILLSVVSSILTTLLGQD